MRASTTGRKTKLTFSKPRLPTSKHSQGEKTELNSLRAEYQRIFATQTPINEICPTCSQKLPADRIAATKEKVEAKKKEELASCASRGKTVADRHNATLAEIQALRDELTAMGELEYPQELNRLKGLLRDVEASDGLFEPDNMPGYIENFGSIDKKPNLPKRS